MNKTKRRRTLFQLLFWTWLIFILINTLSPNQINSGASGKDILFIRLDYLEHFGAYLLLALFFYYWQANGHLSLFKKQFLIFLSGAIVLVVGSEFSQLFIPGRSFNEYDLLANGLGLAGGIIIPQIFSRKAKHKITQSSSEKQTKS
jgi:VanZ family protein